jgi:TRAP-type mannitol/chloroaromatic compound transport system permease small subunit
VKILLLSIDKISELAAKIFSILMPFVVVVIMYEIFARYLFNAPRQWANETMIMGCAFIYLFGGAWTLKLDSHIKMELVYGKLNERGKALVDSITFIFFALYIIMLIWGASIYAFQSFQLKETSGTGWDPPVYPLKIAIVVGACLVFLQGFAKFIRDLYFAIKGKSL